MAKFLHDWDNMLANMRADAFNIISAKLLEHTLVVLLRRSDKLRTYVERYDRQLVEHPDRSYKYLHDMLGKVVVEERQRCNKEILLIEYSSQRKKPPAAAVLTPGMSDATSNPKGKGKNKGKGRGGGGGGDGDSSDSGKSDASTQKA